MHQVLQIAQVSIALLSVPLVTAIGSWLAQRFSRESRLLLRLERLSRIYPNLPEGPSREEYAKRVSETLDVVNRRLDPLAVIERRRKRTAVLVIAALATVVSYVLSFSHNPQPATTVVAIALGGIAVSAFWLIERDTKIKRTAAQPKLF